MRRIKLPFVLLTLFVLSLQSSMAWSQAATPTNDVLFRVLMVQSQYGRGTIFSLDVDQREYWITAKHVLTGAKHPPYGHVTEKAVSLRLLNPGQSGEVWRDETFTVVDPGDDKVDIVVLAPSHLLLEKPLPSVKASSIGLLLGGDCEFLGFPYGSAWRASFSNGDSYWMPFMKHCTVSAFVSTDPIIWLLDGIANEGFSGGPVVFKTGPEQQILGVISGYHTEVAEVVPVDTTAPNPKETVNVNSGFILAFDIHYAIDAIHKNPVGPLRKPNP
jgi:hypothetical protein